MRSLRLGLCRRRGPLLVLMAVAGCGAQSPDGEHSLRRVAVPMPADREQWSAHNVITPQEHLRFCGVACSFTLRPGERVAGCTQIDVDQQMASRLRAPDRAAVVCLFQ